MYALCVESCVCSMIKGMDSQGFTDILEPFCNGPKTEVALINTVQVYCYEDTRIIKAFPQVLKASHVSLSSTRL